MHAYSNLVREFLQIYTEATSFSYEVQTMKLLPTAKRKIEFQGEKIIHSLMTFNPQGLWRGGERELEMEGGRHGEYHQHHAGYPALW